MSYPDADEEARRLRAFGESLEMVAVHNRRVKSPGGGQRKDGYVLDLNRFADMTWCVVLTFGSLTNVCSGC